MTECDKFLEKFPGWIAKANELMIKESTKKKSINSDKKKEMIMLISKLITISNNLHKYYIRFRKPDAVNNIRCNEFTIKILHAQLMIGAHIARLNSFLSLEYCNYHRNAVASNKKNDAEKLLAEAIDYHETALNWNESSQAIFERRNDIFVPRMGQWLDMNRSGISMLTDYINAYSNPVAPIEELAAMARKEKNSKKAYEKFQEAIALAKSNNYYVVMLDLLIEQRSSLKSAFMEIMETPPSLVKPDSCFNVLKKLIWIDYQIVDILPSLYTEYTDNDDINSLLESNRELCSDSICMVRMMLRHFPFITNYETQKIWGDRIKKMIDSGKKMAMKFSNFQQELTTEEEKLQQSINVLNEKKEQERMNCQKEYEEKFNEILASFPAEQPKKIKKKHTSHFFLDDWKWEKEDSFISEDTSDEFLEPYIVSEEELTLPTPLKFEPLLNHSISLNPFKKTFKTGIWKNVCNDFDQADHHRLKALKHIKYPDGISEAITQFEWCNHYLKKVLNDINESLKSSTSSEVQEKLLLIYEWADQVWTESNVALKKLLDEQQVNYTIMETGRQQARNYIIKKYGRQAWFKEEEFNWDKLSIEAQQRLITQDNMQRIKAYLSKMNSFAEQIKNLANNKQSRSSFAKISPENDASLTNNPAKQIEDCILPETLKKAFNLFSHMPGECYLGGSTILSLLEQRPLKEHHDFDFIILARNNQMLHTRLIEKKFFHCPYNSHLYMRKINQHSIDCYVVTSKLYRESLEHYIAFSGEFTITALYCNNEGVVIDPSGQGVSDFKNKLLRTVHAPIQSFKDDPVRLFRAVRYIIGGYNPTEEVDEAIKSWQPDEKVDNPHIEAVVRKYLMRLEPVKQIEYVQCLQQSFWYKIRPAN